MRHCRRCESRASWNTSRMSLTNAYVPADRLNLGLREINDDNAAHKSRLSADVNGLFTPPALISFCGGISGGLMKVMWGVLVGIL